jgi:hypothetical protein
MVNPAGKLGEIVNAPVPVVPEILGVIVVIAVFVTKYAFDA